MSSHNIFLSAFLMKLAKRTHSSNAFSTLLKHISPNGNILMSFLPLKNEKKNQKFTTQSVKQLTIELTNNVCSSVTSRSVQ